VAKFNTIPSVSASTVINYLAALIANALRPMWTGAFSHAPSKNVTA
jgi:hypothetical protein